VYQALAVRRVGTSRKRCIIIGAGVAALLGLAHVPVAHALTDNWNCSRNAGDHCTDSGGAHSWIETDGFSGTGVSSLCIKAENSDGTIHATTLGTWCDSNTTVVARCLTSSTPISTAYSYWESGTGAVSMMNTAITPSQSFC
jgi:hypothetical protein